MLGGCNSDGSGGIFLVATRTGCDSDDSWEIFLVVIRTTREFPGCDLDGWRENSPRVPPEPSESQPIQITIRKFPPEPSESQPEFPPSCPNHNQKVPPEPSESQPEKSPRAVRIIIFSRAVRITINKFTPKPSESQPESSPRPAESYPEVSPYDSDGSGGIFLVMIRTARGEISGCYSDGLGGWNFLVVIRTARGEFLVMIRTAQGGTLCL